MTTLYRVLMEDLTRMQLLSHKSVVTTYISYLMGCILLLLYNEPDVRIE